jgi:hypothetical protein
MPESRTTPTARRAFCSWESDTFQRKDAMGHEPFCTVLLEQLVESKGGIRVRKSTRHRLVDTQNGDPWPRQ